MEQQNGPTRHPTCQLLHNPLPPHVLDTQPNPTPSAHRTTSGSFAADAETA